MSMNFSVSPCLSGKFGFSDHARCRRSRAITAILAACCLRPSATDPTPHRALLKTKAKVQFDRAVTDRSKPFFPVFQDFYPAQFQPCFSVFAVRSAEGRNWKGLVFSGQIASLPIANCLFSKIVQLLPFLTGRKTFNLPFVRPTGQVQKLPGSWVSLVFSHFSLCRHPERRKRAPRSHQRASSLEGPCVLVT
jgi:hypothetical protein